MSIHYVIIADLVGLKNATAHLDVSSDQAPGVRYAVIPSAAPPPGPVQMTDKQFATSPECFKLASATPALVFATTTDLGAPPSDLNVPSQAMLRQKKLSMAVPPADAAMGTQFSFPIGDLGLGAWLLIGNPDVNPADAPISILASPQSAVAHMTVPLNGVVQFQLPPESAGARVVVSSDTGIPLLVQLGILDALKDQAMTIIPRSAP